MKLLKRISVLVMMIAVVAAFVGCGKETSVVGTWEGDDYTYTFNSDGTLLLTRSYRTAKSKSGYISQIRTYIPSYSAVGAKGNIKKNTARAVTTLPPMVEGVAVYGTYTYTLFSSTYYKSCKYPTDRVIAMKTNKLL